MLFKILTIALFATLGAVLMILILGVTGLLKGKLDARKSNILMRWRVGLQALALIFLVLAFWYKARHG